MKTTKWRTLGLLAVMVAAGLYLMELDASARVGGGGSMGSRGSRSYSSPSRPPVTQPTPGAPNVAPRPAAPTPTPAPVPQAGMSPFWRGMAGGVVGGLLGGMLFRGLAGAGGFGGMGGGWGGPGLMDLLFLAAIGFGIYWWVKKRRQAQAVPADGYSERQSGLGYYGPNLTGGTPGAATATQEPVFQQTSDDVQRGLGYIRQMDARFDEAAFKELCEDTFFKLQAAWMNRDVDSVQNLLTTEMQNEFRREFERMKTEGKINRLENIAVRGVEITEAWQEAGQDYLTVRYRANLLDYTADERTGQAIEGSKTDPVKFEEYWTWTRPVGPNSWRLSAINQPD